MKTLILYASKYGTTKKCAYLLADELGGDTCVKKMDETINLAEYDRIMIGSYVRMGQVDKRVKKLCTDNKILLLQKQVSLFLCCGIAQNVQNYYDTNFDSDFIKHCTLKSYFGGEMDLSKMRGIDKFIVKMVSKNGGLPQGKILTENVKKFAQLLKHADHTN